MNCPYCENVIPPGETKCPACGAPAPAVNTAPPPPPQAPAAPPPPPGYPPPGYPQAPAYEAKSHTAFLLLGIFLGQLGVHNFYAGYTVKGIIQLAITLCTCGYGCVVSWIWALIEVCTVKVDSRNIPMK